MNYGKTILEVHSKAEELKQLHQIITDYNLPITSEDSLEKQAVQVSEYLNEPGFIACRAKKQLFNILSGVIALPIFVFIIYMILGKLNIVSEANIFSTILDWFLAYSWAFILYALVFASIVIAHQQTQKKMYRTLYPQLKKELISRLKTNIETHA